MSPSIYYLAPSDADAVRFVGHSEELLAADHVVAYDMITQPHLTSLPDLAEGVPIAIDLSVTQQLWPLMPEDPEADVTWMAEPVIERIADSLRDRVAAIPPGQVAALAEAWSVELNGAVDEGASARLAQDLILLAQRGRDGQLTLYNWYEF